MLSPFKFSSWQLCHWKQPSRGGGGSRQQVALFVFSADGTEKSDSFARKRPKGEGQHTRQPPDHSEVTASKDLKFPFPVGVTPVTSSMSRSGSDLLWVPLKKTSDIDVSKPLRNLIASTYSSSDAPVQMGDKLKEFQKLRQGAIRTSERGEAAAQAIAK